MEKTSYIGFFFWGGGGSLPLIICIRVHSRPIYWGAIQLAINIIRYSISQNKGKCLYIIHPINNYNFLGNDFKIPYFTYITFCPYARSNRLFWLYPNLFFSEPNCILFLKPFFFGGGVCKQHFFHERHFSSYNHDLWSHVMMLNSHELNQNNKPKAKACNWSIVLHYEMKFKYDIELNLCLGTQCSLWLQKLKVQKVSPIPIIPESV